MALLLDAAGFDRYLTKPVAPDVVSELIMAFISKRRA